MLKQDTIDIQHKLARYCRTGNKEDIPGITENRIQEYRRLIYNVIRGNLDQAFPITIEVLDQDQWNQMIDDFFIEHDAKTAQIWKLPFEFYQFVEQKNYQKKYDKPFLNELLYFEWLEIEVYTMKDIPIDAYTESGNLFEHKLTFNLEFKIQPLKFPIHLYATKTAIEKPGNYFVLVYREKETGKVKFVDLSILHAFLIEQLSQTNMSCQDLIPIICETFSIEDTAELHQHIREFINRLHSLGIVLGTSI